MTEQAQEVWLRREGEGAKPYRAFTIYLAMDADRSEQKVSRKLAVSRTIISRWSAQYDWVARARDYDQYVSELRLARLARARESLVDQQIAIAAQMFMVVKSRMSGLRRKQLNAMGLARLFYVACQAVEGAFGDQQPLANTPPRIVFMRIERNKPRDFETENGEQSEKWSSEEVQ